MISDEPVAAELRQDPMIGVEQLHAAGWTRDLRKAIGNPDLLQDAVDLIVEVDCTRHRIGLLPAFDNDDLVASTGQEARCG